MLIIAVIFILGFQQVAIFDSRTGEYQEKRLQHRQEAEQFYRALAGRKFGWGWRPAALSQVRAAAGRVGPLHRRVALRSIAH